MRDPNSIEVRDLVRVFFVSQHNENFRGRVLYVPCATGDSWHIRDQNGTLRYVQTFTEIILEQKGDSNP